MFKSKKFVGMIIGVVTITAILLVCAISAPESLGTGTVSTAIIIIGLIIGLYMAGNSFVKWVISKYFNRELADD